MSDSLKKDQCGVCGAYVCGYPPIQWEQLTTAKGTIQACYACHKRYEGMNCPDPRKHHLVTRLQYERDKYEHMLREIDNELEEVR